MMEESSSEEELHDIEWGDTNQVFNYDDPHITSPQITAVLQNDTERLKTLLKAGKSPNIVDNYGNTPLHISVLKDKREVFNYLLTVKDVRLNAKNFEGATPLMLAVVNLRESYVQKLIKRGANVNIPLDSGDTPLHLTIGRSLPLAVMLIERKADINSQNCDGETPLFRASRKREWDFLYMLLYYGADAMICNDRGTSPFILSLKDGPPEVQEILFNYNFDEIQAEVELKTLVEIMKTKSNFFHKVIERTSHILYTEEDLKYLSENLPYVKADMFKTLLEKFSKFSDDFFNVCDVLMDLQDFLLTATASETKDFIECCYTLCESRFIGTIMDKRQPAKLLISACHVGLPEDSVIEFVCCLLSYGLRMSCSDLNAAYKCYGFGKLFKIMLHMDTVDYDLYRKEGISFTDFFPQVIYNISLTFDDFLKIPKECVTESVLKHVRKLFTIERNILVPSLKELSREIARKNIIHTYKVKNNVHFFTVLRHLPLAQIYVSILTYEKEIYL